MAGPCWDSTWPHLVENACLTNGSVLFLMWTNKSARLERIVSVHSTLVDNNSICNVAYQCFVNGGYPRFQCKPLYMYGYIILLCFSVQFELPFIIRLTKVVFENITRWLCTGPLSQLTIWPHYQTISTDVVSNFIQISFCPHYLKLLVWFQVWQIFFDRISEWDFFDSETYRPQLNIDIWIANDIFLFTKSSISTSVGGDDKYDRNDSIILWCLYELYDMTW